MNFNQAEHKLKAFMRDSGFVGELPQPNKEQSERDSNGFWFLKTIEGRNVGVISEDGHVELV